VARARSSAAGRAAKSESEISADPRFRSSAEPTRPFIGQLKGDAIKY
jgi:hypothetical protein